MLALSDAMAAIIVTQLAFNEAATESFSPRTCALATTQADPEPGRIIQHPLPIFFFLPHFFGYYSDR